MQTARSATSPRQTPWTTPAQVAVLLVVAAVPAPILAQGVEAVEPESDTQRAESESNPNEADQDVWLGVQIGEGADDIAGAPVQRVLSSSPASRAGIEAGDRIRSVADQPVDDLDSLRRALQQFGPGDEVEVQLQRDGSKQTAEVVISARPTRRAILRNQIVGSQLPNVQLKTVTGKRRTLTRSDLKGKPVVLEFWATWCAPCRATAEMLREIHTSFGDDIRIVGISREEHRTLRSYAENVDAPYPRVRDTGELAHDGMLVSSYPTLVVADSSGKIVEIFLGRGHEDELRSTLEELLDSE